MWNKMRPSTTATPLGNTVHDSLDCFSHNPVSKSPKCINCVSVTTDGGSNCVRSNTIQNLDVIRIKVLGLLASGKKKENQIRLAPLLALILHTVTTNSELKGFIFGLFTD